MEVKQRQIQEIAEKLGVPANTVDKDFVIGHFLGELFSNEWAQANFIFKGGTCLKKCYFDNYRFSEDIDITVTNPNLELTISAIQEICDSINEKVGIAFKINSFSRVISNNKFVGWDSKVCFSGANHRGTAKPFGKDCHTFIKLEIRTHEIILFPHENRDILHNYSDKHLISSKVPCYSIYEVLSEKMRSLIQRSRGEARDYYDLWYIKNNIQAIEWEIIKDSFLKKCDYKKIKFTEVNDFFQENRLRQVATNWDGRLSHQLPKNMQVDRDIVITELRLFFFELFNRRSLI